MKVYIVTCKDSLRPYVFSNTAKAADFIETSAETNNREAISYISEADIDLEYIKRDPVGYFLLAILKKDGEIENIGSGRRWLNQLSSHTNHKGFLWFSDANYSMVWKFTSDEFNLEESHAVIKGAAEDILMKNLWGNSEECTKLYTKKIQEEL